MTNLPNRYFEEGVEGIKSALDKLQGDHDKQVMGLFREIDRLNKEVQQAHQEGYEKGYIAKGIEDLTK